MVGLFGADCFDRFDGSMKVNVTILAEEARTIRGLRQHVAVKRAMMAAAVANLEHIAMGYHQNNSYERSTIAIV